MESRIIGVIVHMRTLSRSEKISIHITKKFKGDLKNPVSRFIRIANC